MLRVVIISLTTSLIFLLSSCGEEEPAPEVPVVKNDPQVEAPKEEPKAQGKQKVLVKDKKGWKICGSSSSMPDSMPIKAIDGKPNTFWHTEWRPKRPGHPHHIAVDLGEELEIFGFSYLTRQDKTLNGTINEYEFYVSNDNKNWGEAAASGVFEDIKYDKGLQVIYFEKMLKGRYIKLVSKSEILNQPFACCSEINVVVEE